MNQPYIYTMPESFLGDQSVPARWRLLAVINGFLLNGKTFYGSNEWLMSRLYCSEQTVSNAVKELEDLGEIVCTRTRRSRVITRKLRDPNQLGSETQVDSVRDPSSFGTNSVKSSVSKIPANAGFTIEPEEGPKPKKTPSAIYEPLLQWAEVRTERKFVNRIKQYTALKKARSVGIKSLQLKERWEELEAKPFYEENGLDWTSVVSSFDKKI